MNIKKDKDNVTYLENYGKKLNKKKLLIVGIVGIIVLILIIGFIVYSANEQFRIFCDTYILRKEIEEDNLSKIEIDDVNVSNVFAYSNYIAIIKDNVLTKYNTSGNEESQIKMEITKPLIVTNESYAIIAEQAGQKAYLIKNSDIVWEKTLEGNIAKVNVNSNGYVSIILSGTSYKSVIILYDEKGNELFKTYLSSTIAVDSDISIDNKYLSFAEVNTAGTLIQSNIKIISVEKAKQSPSDSIIYTYKANENSLIVDIKYQKNKLVCMYDDAICVIENKENKQIASLNETGKKITFCDIGLYDFAVRTVEESNGLFSTKTAVELINTSSLKNNVYNLTGSIKELYCYGDRLGVNLGSEVHFIDINGWLVKKYISSQEIRGIVMNNKIAGIIYKNKIEIVNL